jgi:hypothetical protein
MQALIPYGRKACMCAGSRFPENPSLRFESRKPQNRHPVISFKPEIRSLKGLFLKSVCICASFTVLLFMEVFRRAIAGMQTSML